MLWIFSVLLLALILGESGIIFQKLLKENQSDGIPSIQAESKDIQAASTTALMTEATPGQGKMPDKNPETVSTEGMTEQKGSTQEQTAKETQVQENKMEELIVEKVGTYDGVWSVYLKTKGMKVEEICDIYSPDHGRGMKSASLIKLFVMETLYDQANQGVLQREQMQGLIGSMITVSDNTACNTLVTDFLGNGSAEEGMAQVTWYAKQHGYSDTSMGRLMLSYQTSGDNYTSAKDCVTLLEKIYDRICVSTEDSGQMLSFLQNQERRNKISYGLQTRLLGEEEWVANKTGEIAQAEVPEKGMVEGDAAIVHTTFGDYILCILVNDMESNSQAQLEIQELSGWIYDYLAAENK